MVIRQSFYRERKQQVDIVCQSDCNYFTKLFTPLLSCNICVILVVSGAWHRRENSNPVHIFDFVFQNLKNQETELHVGQFFMAD